MFFKSTFYEEGSNERRNLFYYYKMQFGFLHSLLCIVYTTEDFRALPVFLGVTLF